MKARLDHVAIAVSDVERALAFYRDALGLDVLPAVDVAAEGVRVRFVPGTPTAIELLEPLDPATPVGRFVAAHGPGLHHLTLRVEDLDVAVARLQACGARLAGGIRVGAEGARVAFVHPASAHGVLVELREDGASRPSAPPALEVQAIDWGGFRLVSLHDGLIRLDGGAMFGVVPRVLWERRMVPDERNRVCLAMRPLLIESARGRLLVDCGVGDALDARQEGIYGLDRSRHLDHALAAAGVTPEAIDRVLLTHLHFDHVGGATTLRDGRRVPRFPAAEYFVRKGEWEDAVHPHARNRASYLVDTLRPLEQSGVVRLFEQDGEVEPGVRVHTTGGHTRHHQVVYIESEGRTAVFAGDLVPTVAHVDEPWIMAYDLHPVQTLRAKTRLLQEAIDREYLIFFEHDPVVSAGYIRERDGRRYVEQVL
ncbi:MAG: MBL fold metallo-hydrolase [Acidobacteria bacterium]|nr:MBL fold metallo-hydrolase [Acidobacteriota bacterium]